MKTEVLKRTMYGIAYGGIYTFIALTILMILQITPPIFQTWLYMLAGLMLGVYFAVASFIFEVEAWSPLKKTVIHFVLSIVLYFIIALSVGWVPFTFTAIIRSEEHTSELQSRGHLVCRLLLEKKKTNINTH